MVRVISVHHFNRQDVSSVAPPLATTITNDNLLLVATDSLQIEVRNLKKASELSHCFQTIDMVTELLYSPVGNYVGTLEGKRGKKGASVRVYVNWDDPKVEGAPLRPRIASRVTPSMQSQEVTLDMIEFPLRDSPLQIAVCPGTGNLIVAATNVMVIYKYALKIQETSKTKYVDFEDCVHIFHNFLPREIALVESVVACLSDTEVHVFRLKLVDSSDDERNMRSCSVYSFSSESESLPASSAAQRRSSEESDSGIQPHPPLESAEKIKTNVTAKRQQDSEANETHLEGYGGNVRLHAQHVAFGTGYGAKKIVLPDIEKADREYFAVGPPKIMDQTLGPCTPPGGNRGGSGGEIIVKLVPTSDQDCSVEAEAITLVHCKLLPAEEQHEIFQNLKLKPVYWKEFRVRKKDDAFQGSLNPLHSAYHPHLMALSLCFTSLNEGFLYHLPGHLRKPGRGCGVQKIATYPFTSPVSKIALEPTLLHALTQTGLETYTLRSGYSTVMEAEAINGRTNACPSSQTPICLVGLRPFLGAKHLEVGGNFLVLMASADDPSFSGNKGSGSDLSESGTEHNKKWTIYSLELPTPITLQKDMTELANMNRALSPQGYLQLLCEAHVVLRTAFHQLAWQNLVAPSPDIEKELEETRQKYRETCITLGNYYVMSDSPKEWKLAIPYYRMAQRSVFKILTQAKTMWLNQADSNGGFGGLLRLPPGLVDYMVEVILNPVPGEDVLEASLADLIIDLLGKYALQTLAQVVLKSPTFRDFKATKMYNYLKDHVEAMPRPDADEVVAFALLCVDRGAGEEARAPLQALAPVHLAEIVLQFYDFLLDEAGGSEPTFSEFAILLRDTVPDTFVEILVSLIKANVFPLSTILHLFIESFVSMSGMNSNNCSGGMGDMTVHHASTLQLFLEAYFTETLSEIEIELDPDETRALHTLIRSYLTSLSVPVRFGEKNIDSNMFGPRQLYLDQLSPFDCASDPAEKAILNTDSPDFWCQNSLLKLQSLLLSPLCKSSNKNTTESDQKMLSAPCKEIILNYLSMKDETIGSLSLRLICVLDDDINSSISLLVENKPDVILAFGKEHKLDLEGWKAVLRCLQDQVNDRPNDHPLHEVWYTAMQEVLEHLAQTLLLEAFLEVLPGPPSSEDFQAYIQICRKNEQANHIKRLIVTTGHDMLTRLVV